MDDTTEFAWPSWRQLWVAAAVGCVVLIPVGLAVRWLSVDWELRETFDALEAGMTRAEVHSRLGEPVREDIEFRLGQFEGNEKEYAKAARSKAAYYLFWTDFDWTFAVGFDAQDRVVVTASGGT